MNAADIPSPDETFQLGREIGPSLKAGDVVLLYGELGAGKTLLTKGILASLDFDVDEVTSPSFALVNLYKTEHFDVYHVDLWRVEDGRDPVTSVGLDEILEPGSAVVIIEWADRLGDAKLEGRRIEVKIKGDGDEPRKIRVTEHGDRSVVIRKGERRLEVYRGDSMIESYEIALGPSPVGQKEREGDGRTPEGEYLSFAKNPKSRHHVSLAISYPDMAAVERGFENGVIDENTRNQAIFDLEERDWIPQETPLGGKIYIHGGGCAADWTDGCIALKDNEMQALYDAAFVGMKVTILP